MIETSAKKTCSLNGISLSGNAALKELGSQPILKVVFCILFLLFSVQSFGQFPEERLFDLPLDAGTIKHIEEDQANNLVYYAGDFKTYGLPLDKFALLNPEHDSINANFPFTTEISPHPPRANTQSAITCVAATQNGWYVGGYFTKLKNQEIKFLAFIDENGVVHESEFRPNGEVTMLYWQDNLLVIAGEFSMINDIPKHGLAVINTNTNELLENTPGLSTSSGGFSEISAITIDDNEVFLTGTFDLAGELTTKAIVGESDQESVLFPATGDDVRAVVPDNHGGWFVGGAFTQYGSKVRKRLAQIDSLGQVTDFNFEFDDQILDLALHNDTLYIAGVFNSVNGEHRPNLAAIDLTSEELTPLKTEVDGIISKLAVNDESIVISGDYNWVGNTWEHITQLDVESMSVERLYDSPIFEGFGSIYHVVSDGFGGWFIVGDFTHVGSEPRLKIAHIDQGGHLSDWQLSPSINIQNPLLDLFKRIDDKLFISGNFQSDATSSDLLCVSTVTGEYVSLNIELDGTVNDLIQLENQLIIGGDFQLDTGGVDITSTIARYSFLQDTVTLFENHPLGEVETLATDGDKVFAFGTFETEEGEQGIKCYDVLTLEEQQLQIESNGSISAIYLNNDRLFVQGDFTEINGQERNQLAAFDVNSLQLTNWTLQNVNLFSGFADGGSIEFDDEYIYLTPADVIDMPGLTTGMIRADLNSGLADVQWNLFTNNSILVAFRSPFDLHDGKIFARSNWGTVGYQGVCALDRSGNYTHWIDSLTNQSLSQMEWHGDFLYVRNSSGITRYDEEGKKDNWALEGVASGQAIRKFKIVSDMIVMSGFDMTINGEIKKGLAVADLESGDLLPTSFFVGNQNFAKVIDFDVHQDMIYAVSFSNANGNPYVRSFDLFTGEENSTMTPVITNYQKDFDPYINFSGDKFLIFLNRYGGDFTRFFSFDVDSGELTDYYDTLFEEWSLVNPEFIKKMRVKDNKIILSGNTRFYALDRVTKAPLWDNFYNSEDFELLGDSLIITHGPFFAPNGSQIYSLDINDGTLNPWSPISTQSEPNMISWVNGKLVFSGAINLPGFEESFDFVYLDTLFGELLQYTSPHFNIDLDYTGEDIEIPKTEFYSNEHGTLLKGDFSGMERISQNNILSRNTVTGEVTSWAPQLGITGESNPDITITGMHLYGDSIYLSGTFTEVNGVERLGFASINRFDGELGSWNPSFPEEAEITIWGFDDKLVFTGNIENAFQESRDQGAIIDLDDFSLSPLNLDVPTSYCVLADDALFVHGNFEETFGQSRNYWASYNTSGGELLPFNVSPLFYPPAGGNSSRCVVTDSTVIIRSGFIGTGFGYDLRVVDRYTGALMNELNTEDLIIDDDAIAASADRLYFIETRSVSGLAEPRSSLNYFLLQDNELSAWTDMEHFQRDADISFENDLLFANHKIYELPICEIAMECRDTVLNLSQALIEFSAEDLVVDFENTCGDLSFQLDINSLDCSNLGANTIQITATSTAELSLTCTSEIQLIDTIGPNIECANPDVDLNDNNLPELEMSDLISGSLSTCEVSDLSIDTDLNFSCDQAGTEFEILVVASDLSGNSSVCTSTVSITIDDPDEDGIDASCDTCFGTDSSGDDDNDGVCNDLDLCLGDDSSGDLDGDGICNDLEVVGCQDPNASNYNPDATDPSFCDYSVQVADILTADEPIGSGIIGNPNDGFTVSPNPSYHEDVTIVFDTTSKDDRAVFLYDLLGRKITRVDVKPEQKVAELTNLFLLSPGTYLIVVQSTNGIRLNDRVLLIH